MLKFYIYRDSRKVNKIKSFLCVGKVFSLDEPCMGQKLENFLPWNCIGNPILDWRLSVLQPAEASESVSYSEHDGRENPIKLTIKRKI